MKKNTYSFIWWLIFAGLVAASLYFVTPPKDKVRLGLDLAGGTSFTVQIDKETLREDIKKGLLEEAADKNKAPTEEQIEAKLNLIMRDALPRTVEVIRNRIDNMGVNEPVIVPSGKDRIIVEIPGADEAKRKEAEDNIRAVAQLRFSLVHARNDQLVDKLIASGTAPEGYEIASGDSRASKCFARTAKYDELVKDKGYLKRVASFRAPANASLMLQPEVLEDGRKVYVPHYVQNKAEMTGEGITSAEVERNPQNGQISVNLAFDATSQAKFAQITEYYRPNGSRNRNNAVGRQLAIILDNTLYSAPVIQTRIDGNAEITGRFSYKDAYLLRNALKAGALPVPIEVIEQRTIDPTLGQDAINSGVLASIIGGGLVILFMLFYYCYFGLVADMALLLNIVLLPVGMILVSGVFSAVGAVETTAGGSFALPVLTMPGIAGIVLTIGMAVDANVLIFERIREEFKLGKSPRVAIAAGYDRAFQAIFDSNITTFLTAVILFIFGSGPIRGFAITLSAGIIVSMYTALIITRMVFSVTVPEIRTTPYKMRDLFNFKSIDFLGMGRKAMYISGAIIFVTLAIFAIRCLTSPRDVMSIDFTGGTVMAYTVDKIPENPLEKIKSALKEASIDDAAVQVTQANNGQKAKIEIKSGYDQIQIVQNDKPVKASIGFAATSALKKAFPDSNFSLSTEDTIGSQVGDDLKINAFRAVLIALVGMIVYITIRFEFGFALGAIAALAHDVLITLGLYSLFGRQLGVTAIACLLTIVGYSINDTIVIFDRIREDMRMDPRMSFRELCNRSINQTLSRTILTSLTTLLATLALFVFGGGAINDFALCMLIGIVAGVYSTIFIATPIMVAWYKGRRPSSLAAVQK